MKKYLRMIAWLMVAVMLCTITGIAAAAAEPDVIDKVTLTFTAPKAGTVSTEDANKVPGLIKISESTCIVEAGCWFHEAGSWSEVSDLEKYTFEAGKTYTCWITLKANAGYHFPLDKAEAELTVNGAKLDEIEDVYTSPDGSYSALVAILKVTISGGSTPTDPDPEPEPEPDISLTLKKVTVRKSAKSLTLTATLKVDGKAVKNKKITFTFNGKKYTAKTNKKGVATVTIKKAVLKKLEVGKKITIKATFKGVTDKLSVKVKK